MYQIYVTGRDYQQVTLHDSKTFQPIEMPKDFNPIQSKLFHQDIFHKKTDEVDIIHSSLRQRTNIPGVLVLQGNRMYGRYRFLVYNKSSIYYIFMMSRREDTTYIYIIYIYIWFVIMVEHANGSVP